MRFASKGDCKSQGVSIHALFDWNIDIVRFNKAIETVNTLLIVYISLNSGSIEVIKSNRMLDLGKGLNRLLRTQFWRIFFEIKHEGILNGSFFYP